MALFHYPLSEHLSCCCSAMAFVRHRSFNHGHQATHKRHHRRGGGRRHARATGRNAFSSIGQVCVSLVLFCVYPFFVACVVGNGLHLSAICSTYQPCCTGRLHHFNFRGLSSCSVDGCGERKIWERYVLVVICSLMHVVGVMPVYSLAYVQARLVGFDNMLCC